MTSWDLIIVGGGPSGSALACMLKQKGMNVLLCERVEFPRHQIGESLLPGSLEILEEIGVLPKIYESGFLVKPGASFYSERSKRLNHFPFSEAMKKEYPTAFQVLREKFDHLLLNHARSMGVEVLQPYSVDQVSISPDHVTINGGEHQAKMIVWANGIGNIQHMPDNYVKNSTEDQITAIYSYFEADFSQQEHYGNIIVNLFYEDQKDAPQWAWAIPLEKDFASVGFVINSQQLKEKIHAQKTVDAVGLDLLDQNPYLHNFIKRDRATSPFRLRHNFQRVAKQLVWDRQLLIGDAAGFIDPVFSSGVHIGLNSAKYASEVIDQAMRTNDFSSACFKPFELKYRKLFRSYYQIAKSFYQRNVVESLFLSGKAVDQNLIEKQQQFTTLLAGDCESENPLLEMFNSARLNINPEVSLFL